MSRNKDWNRSPRKSPIVTIFILFDKEMPDEERSRGIVMKIPCNKSGEVKKNKSGKKL